MSGKQFFKCFNYIEDASAIRQVDALLTERQEKENFIEHTWIQTKILITIT